MDTTAPTGAIVQRGIRWLIDDVSDDESAILHIPVWSNLQGSLEAALGPMITKNLKKNKTANIEGTTIHLSSDASMASGVGKVKLLCLYSRSEELDTIESHFRDISRILVVPWISSDISEWKEVRRAVELG